MLETLLSACTNSRISITKNDTLPANKLVTQVAIHNLVASSERRQGPFPLRDGDQHRKDAYSGGIIKPFLRSGNAVRVLFLADRLEVEDQAQKAFVAVLANDYRTVIFKEKRDDWRRADIVVSTVQSFLFNNKYQHISRRPILILSSPMRLTDPSTGTPERSLTTSSATNGSVAIGGEVG
jgi:hypothetical protein